MHRYWLSLEGKDGGGQVHIHWPVNLDSVDTGVEAEEPGDPTQRARHASSVTCKNILLKKVILQIVKYVFALRTMFFWLYISVDGRTGVQGKRP